MGGTNCHVVLSAGRRPSADEPAPPGRHTGDRVPWPLSGRTRSALRDQARAAARLPRRAPGPGSRRRRALAGHDADRVRAPRGYRGRQPRGVRPRPGRLGQGRGNPWRHRGRRQRPATDRVPVHRAGQPVAGDGAGTVRVVPGVRRGARRDVPSLRRTPRSGRSGTSCSSRTGPASRVARPDRLHPGRAVRSRSRAVPAGRVLRAHPGLPARALCRRDRRSARRGRADAARTRARSSPSAVG